MGVNAALDQLALGDHVCCPVSATEQTWAVAAAGTACGLRDGQKVLFIVDDPDGLRGFLAGTAVGAERALATGQLQVHPSAGTDTRDAGFNADQMVDMLRAEIDLADRQGFAGVRATGDFLSAIVRHRHNTDAVIDYECRANAIFAEGHIIGICHYDPRALASATWQRVFSAHPTTLLPTGNGTLTRLHGARIPSGIRLTGTADLANRDALPALLAGVVAIPGACRIDTRGLEFVDVPAIGCLLRTAAARSGRPTIIVCGTQLAGLLQLCGAGSLPDLVVTVESP